MRTHRLSAVLAAVLGLAALQVVVAGPAAADHTLDVSEDGCFKGTITLGIPIILRTDRVVIRTLRDGRVQARCHFRGLPPRIDHPDFPGTTWVRPSRATRVTRPSDCSINTDDVRAIGGRADAVITPAGTLKVTCTWTPPFATP